MIDMLEIIEQLEKFTAGLDRMDFFENKNGEIEVVELYLIQLCVDISKIMESDSDILLKYNNIPWKKYVKIGELIDKGFWILIFQKAWTLASREIKDIRKVLEEILEIDNQKIIKVENKSIEKNGGSSKRDLRGR